MKICDHGVSFFRFPLAFFQKETLNPELSNKSHYFSKTHVKLNLYFSLNLRNKRT